jgi:hypothetical protein
MTKRTGFLEFLAGAGIGSVVGFVAGLTVSSVASTLLGALSTGLLVLLGLKASTTEEQSTRQTLRVAGFGILCSLCLLLGVYLRTNQTLAPSLTAQNSTLAIVFPDPAVRQQILLLTNYGLQYPSVFEDHNDRKAANETKPQNPGSTENSSVHPAPTGRLEVVDKGVPSAESAGLLRVGASSFCAFARRDKFKDLPSYLAALDRFNPPLKKLIESAPIGYQDDLSHSLSQYLCH